MPTNVIVSRRIREERNQAVAKGNYIYSGNGDIKKKITICHKIKIEKIKK